MHFAGDNGDLDPAGGGPRVATAVLAAPVVVWVLVAVAAVWWPAGYYEVVAEDHVFEWIQVGGFAMAAGGLLAVAGTIRTDNPRAAVAAALGCAFFVVVVGEELAWGQRLFGVSVPALERVNQQGDVSLHNVGPGLRLSQVGLLGMALVGLLGRPVAQAWGQRRGRPVSMDGLPPPCLASWFALAAAFTAARLLLLPSPTTRVAKFSEVAELTVAVAAAISAVLLARAVARSRRATRTPPADLVAGPTRDRRTAQ